VDLRTWRTEKFKVAGEQVTMELRPLFNEHLTLLAPYLEKGSDNTRSEEQSRQDSLEALPVLKTVLSACARNVQGITIEGAECQPTDIAEDVRLQALAWEAIVRLTKISTLDKPDEGNSSGESPAPEVEVSG